MLPLGAPMELLRSDPAGPPTSVSEINGSPQRITRPADTQIVATKLGLHTALSDEARQALGAFLGYSSEFPAGALIARAGEAANLISIVANGAAVRASFLSDGARQIHSILFAGDTADVETSLLTSA